MKKDEITRVRLLSLAVLMALSLFILLVLVGNNEFGQIISKMNNNSLNISENQNSVYNLYYYTGFNVIYQLFFSLTVLFTAVSLTGIVLRIGNTGIIASVAAIFNMMTGIFVVSMPFGIPPENTTSFTFSFPKSFSNGGNPPITG